MTFSSTMLPQTNEPEEIQKCFLDLLQKVNAVSDSVQTSAASISSQVSSVQTLDNVVYFSAGLYIPTNAPNALYVMSGNTTSLTITLPSRAASIVGAKYTFRKASSGLTTLTVSTASGDTIGSSGSTSFVLYSLDDFVTLENDGVTWSVVSTSGPILSASQNATSTVGAGSWQDIGTGANLSLSLPNGQWLVSTLFTGRLLGSAYSTFRLQKSGVSFSANVSMAAVPASYIMAPFFISSKILLLAPDTVTIGCFSTPNGGEITNAAGNGTISAQRLA